MSTKPHHDPASVALDARRVHDASVTSLTNKLFAKRVSRPELSELLADIEGLEQASGERPDALVAKVAAGVHAARARAALMSFAANVREDAHIELASDAAMQRAFGVGVHASAGSTREVKSLGEALLAAAAKHPKEAAKVGLDAHGVRDLEDMIHALDGADLAHAHATTERHTVTTHADSLAHVVAAEMARLRRVAHRVFKAQPDKLSAFAHTLPRHAIEPRTHVTPPPAPAAAAS